MKRIFTIALLIIAVAVSAISLVACSEKEETASVVDYEIESTTYYVGDAYDSTKVKVTANMSDETTIAVDSNLFFSGDDATTLKLDEDGNFTTADTYKVKVYLLVADDREDDRFLLGEWELVVKAKK